MVMWHSGKVLSAVMVVGLLMCLLVGCGSGGGPASEPQPLSPQQITRIEQTSQGITQVVTSANGTETEALAQACQYAQTQPGVSKAVVDDGQLIVQYTEGGQEVWVGSRPLPTPPGDIEQLQALTRSIRAMGRSTTRTPVGSRNAVLINALYDDPGFSPCQTVFTNISDILSSTGFTVNMLNGAQATPDALRQLTDAAVIVFLGHGGKVNVINGSGDSSWMTSPYANQIGQSWEDGAPSSYSADWLLNRVVKMNVPWGEGSAAERNQHPRSFVAVTGRFWHDAYKSRHFNRALFVNCACSGAKYPAFYQNLFDVGVAAYSGWTDEQGKAPYTAWRLIASLSSGRTLQEAVDRLPDEYKTDDAAAFWYGPQTESALTLGGTNPSGPTVIINAPFNGETIVDRQCEVRGQIDPWIAGMHATVQVNGQSTALPVATDGTFNQPVGLRAGSNHIRVSVIGSTEVSDEVFVTGEFNNDILYTTLWWNTDGNDIDLHLKPIAGADGATSECYFGNKNPWWGAALDVDDVDGFGPEHITARTLPAGTYLLYVHYYSTHGQTEPAGVNVAVSVNGNPSRIFTLRDNRRMTATGDVWNVCTIDFPSGNMQVLDEFTTASRLSRSNRALQFPAKPK